ncbi:hypothetical protein Syun_030740 [Stephania yunnanensis]|uniref:Uncharacterized protein n=1 Tax=Stephania yunnanensis TaxID=152371 RepID=A0AAP0DZ08_9MAGN
MKKKKKVVEGDDHGGDQGKEKMTGVGSQPPVRTAIGSLYELFYGLGAQWSCGIVFVRFVRG